MTKVILVDKNDKEIGQEEKIKAHKEGKLHRAFSVFLFNKKGEMLLQKRAKEKYHSGGLWSNTCCSHPRPGKVLIDEVKRRLKEEMGIEEKEVKDLKEVFTLIYKLKLGDLTEHEFDHVFLGRFDGKVNPDPTEVEDFKWINLQNLKKDIKENPKKYTEWFRIILERLIDIKFLTG